MLTSIDTATTEAHDFRRLAHWHGPCVATPIMHAFMRLPCLLCAALCLSGCAPMLAVVGYHQSVVQVVAQLERVKLLGDGVSYVGSGKTLSDQALSRMTGTDCRILNVVSGEPVCATGNVDMTGDAIVATVSAATDSENSALTDSSTGDK